MSRRSPRALKGIIRALVYSTGCCLLVRAVATGEQATEPGARPAPCFRGGEDWSNEDPQALGRFLQIMAQAQAEREKWKEGEEVREALVQERVRRWTEFLNDFPDSRLCVHACWRLAACHSYLRPPARRDYAKTSEYCRRAYELFPELLSMETVYSRTEYACASPERKVTNRRRIELYRWLRTTAPELVAKQHPKINSFGYYLPLLPQIYGRGDGIIRGENPTEAARGFLGGLVRDTTKNTERNLVAAATHPDPNYGWQILEELGDLLPQDVQAQIADVVGSGGPAQGEPTVEDLAAEAEFDADKTVLDPVVADRLDNPDVYLPPAVGETGRGAISAMRDSSQWVRRVLQKKWWPRRDRPRDYIAVTSPRGYECVYRHWRAGGTSFLVQSTYGWLELSLRNGAPSDQAPRLDPKRVQSRLVEVARSYLEDPYNVIEKGRFDLKPAPYGFEARLHLDVQAKRRFDDIDGDHQFDWLRGMKVHTDGTSFLFRFEPKTDRDGKIRDDRKRWFHEVPMP